MDIFKLFRKKKSYSEIKAEMEIREDLYSRMSQLSDSQFEKWVSIRMELRQAKEASGVKTILRIANKG